MWNKAILGEGGVHYQNLCEIIGEPLIEDMVVGTKEDMLLLEERGKVEEEKYALQTAFLKQWLDSGTDALLEPSKQWMGYTAIWNLLNYAAVTVPVAKASGDLHSVGGGKNADWEAYPPRNESDEFDYAGMPVCVQIIGGRFGEEKAAAVGEVVDQLMNPTPSIQLAKVWSVGKYTSRKKCREGVEQVMIDERIIAATSLSFYAILVIHIS
ncbi:hypothetical protein N7468_005912 [Penicillium chermesinum]|uniref:Uncharacterized protein n=1 Tax=Penicillium chermesinum TaxID=63820 RepID=A0A9W9TNE3_9EURO|nr:uncharacterized protein N7468_005912 [Penicillium chermesinum]KAJ5232956.1 hypothetical protein N7468_005912 [Penicillium chermesinum]KAJ6172604.1 hypothetical protein N7470_001671 [Penicillium chermesinum]